MEFKDGGSFADYVTDAYRNSVEQSSYESFELSQNIDYALPYTVYPDFGPVFRITVLVPLTGDEIFFERVFKNVISYLYCGEHPF